jgi:hypothetical protein
MRRPVLDVVHMSARGQLRQRRPNSAGPAIFLLFRTVGLVDLLTSKIDAAEQEGEYRD